MPARLDSNGSTLLIDNLIENAATKICYLFCICRYQESALLSLSVGLSCLSIRGFAFQWDSDIEDLCTQNKWAKSGIPREKLS